MGPVLVILSAALSALLCTLWSLGDGWTNPQGAEDLVLRTQLISQGVRVGGFLGAVLNSILWLWRGENTLADAMVSASFGFLFYSVYCQMGPQDSQAANKEE